MSDSKNKLKINKGEKKLWEDMKKIKKTLRQSTKEKNKILSEMLK